MTGKMDIKTILGKKRILFAAGATIFIVHTFFFSFFIMDDAGITYSYARSIFNGKGSRLCEMSEVVEGYSNPLWLFLLGILQKINLFHPVWTPKIIGMLCSIGVLFLGALWLSEATACSSAIFFFLLPLALGLHTPFVL